MLLGVDIVQTDRIARAIKNSKLLFLQRVLTAEEQSYITDAEEDIERIAGLWAAKEAAVKALGTGFRLGISFHDIVIKYDDCGAPYYCFLGQFREIMQKKALSQSALSISHCQTHAIAAAILS